MIQNTATHLTARVQVLALHGEVTTQRRLRHCNALFWDTGLLDLPLCREMLYLHLYLLYTLYKRQVVESSTNLSFPKTRHSKSFSAFVRNGCKRQQGRVLIFLLVYLEMTVSRHMLQCSGSA